MIQASLNMIYFHKFKDKMGRESTATSTLYLNSCDRFVLVEGEAENEGDGLCHGNLAETGAVSVSKSSAANRNSWDL